MKTPDGSSMMKMCDLSPVWCGMYYFSSNNCQYRTKNKHSELKRSFILLLLSSPCVRSCGRSLCATIAKLAIYFPLPHPSPRTPTRQGPSIARHNTQPPGRMAPTPTHAPLLRPTPSAAAPPSASSSSSAPPPPATPPAAAPSAHPAPPSPPRPPRRGPRPPQGPGPSSCHPAPCP
jgi:hypothetical protein